MGTSSRPSMESDDVLLVPCRQTTTEERARMGKEKWKETIEEKGDKAGLGVLVAGGDVRLRERQGEGQVDRWGGWDREDREKLWLVGALRDPRRSTGWLDPAGGGFKGDLECGGG